LIPQLTGVERRQLSDRYEVVHIVAAIERVIRSFDDLVKMVATHDADNFVYRGEDNIRYPLRPKFGRDETSVEPDAISIERSLLAEFKRRSVPHVTQTPVDDWEWLSLAQHFGLATRLLDWTGNPLVAAYFAMVNLEKRSDRVIYAIKESAFEKPNKDQSPFAIDSVCLYRPKHLTARISAQVGLFTVHADPAIAFESDSLERWIVEEQATISLAIRLDTFGFNRATMFPGLDGLADHINEWHLGLPRKESV